MSTRIIGTIMRKDLHEFSRNRFFVFMTLLVLVVWVAVFWFLPDSVEETLRVGVSGFDREVVNDEAAGLNIVPFPSAEALRTGVEENTDDIVAGITFPDGFRASVTQGDVPTVNLLIPVDVPAEQQAALERLVAEVAYAAAGEALAVNPVTQTEILGVDRVGAQVSLQQQMRPLLLILVLMVETFALSALVAVEVQARTVTAILATPAKVVDFVAAKGIFGTGLAFFEVALLGLLIGALAVNAPLVLTALLLGAVLVTGFGMIAGAFGRDFMETLLISMLFMIPLMIPAFGALFPGSTAAWIKALPTYGLVETVVGVTVDGQGWADVGGALLLLAAWGFASLVAGAVILRRRVATL